MAPADSENRPPESVSSTLPPRPNSRSSSPLQHAFAHTPNRSPGQARPHSEDDRKLEASSSSAGVEVGSTEGGVTARKTAVYPHNLAQKQARKFARSAEKRQSVHMLGSIEHLQHHFTKFGLASKVAPDLKGTIQPAVGPLCTTSPTTPTPLPLPPLPPVVLERAPYPLSANIKVDPVALRKEVVGSLQAVEVAWNTRADLDEKDTNISILDLLKTTASAIRLVRAYSLALPTSSLGGQDQTSASRRTSESLPNRRPRHSISTPSRPAPAPAPNNTTGNLISPDPLTPLRRSALDVLTGLRAIEERSRVQGCNDAPHNTGVSSSGFLSRSTSPALSDHIAEGQPPVLADWTAEDDRDEAFFFAERGGDIEEETRKPWEERLGSGGEGWSYRDDVNLDSLAKERETLKRYLDMVETVIFPAERGKRGDGRAWNVKVAAATRRKSDGGGSMNPQVEDLDRLDEVAEEAEGVDGDAVSLWASEDWKGTEMERLHEFLLRHLPLDLCLLIPSPLHDEFETRLLTRLSDGYLVIQAFNRAIDRAAAPWGHVASDDIYDTLDQDAATFRKVANLKSWGAALKLRYGIPLHFPAEPAPVTSIVPLQPSSETAAPDKPQQRRLASGSHPKLEGIAYDPAIIARNGEGWEKAFREVLGKWIHALASQARKEE